MNARDLDTARVIGCAFRFIRSPAGRPIWQKGQELGKSDDLDELRLLRAADVRRTKKHERESGNTSGCFHSGFGRSACTRLTLTRPFVKTRSVWRSKWTIIIIVLIAVVVRLIEIEQPFIDPWSWRQSDVAAIARNFLENGFHFSHPQIDWAGNAPG